LKPEGRLEKERAFRNRADSYHDEKEAPSVIEDIFVAMVHFIAFGLNMKYGMDIVSHSRHKRYLRDNGMNDLLHDYQQVKLIRIGSVYDSRWNGDRVKRAREALERVIKWTEEIGDHR